MYRVVLFSACVAICRAHAVLPLAHSVHAVAPVISYSHGGLGLGHSYNGLGHSVHGYASAGLIGHGYGHGLLSHGYGANPVHLLLKRSPHYVPVGHLGGVGQVASVGHLGPLGHVAGVGAVGPVAPLVTPLAVSHQSRVDVRSSPALITPVLPVIKPVVAPVLHAAPLHYGTGHLGHY